MGPKPFRNDGSSRKIWNFFRFWGLALVIWLGVAYELYAFYPEIINALNQYHI